MDTKWIHKLWVGLKLRCPNCEKGHTFSGLLKANTTCEVCGVRFERQDGESIGGMYINLVFAELTTIVGFFTSQALFSPPLAVQLIFWITYNVLFCVLFYRHSRSAWMAISFISGDVYKDRNGITD